MSPTSSSCNTHSRISVRFLHYASHQFSPSCKIIKYAFPLRDKSFGNFFWISMSPASMCKRTHTQGLPFKSSPPRKGLPFKCSPPRKELPFTSSPPRTGLPFNCLPPRKGLPFQNFLCSLLFAIKDLARFEIFLCHPRRALVTPILAYL